MNTKPFTWIENWEPALVAGLDAPCWDCTSHSLAGTRDGYPVLEKDRIKYVASRYIYEQCFGEIPDGKIICHKCDNSRCINPEHLYAGSYKDNSNDRGKRNRTAIGEKHGRVRLTENDVRQIRGEKNLNHYQTVQKYKAIYGVSEGCLWHIVLNHNWQWVK